jgi:hypothetical protein
VGKKVYNLLFLTLIQTFKLSTTEKRVFFSGQLIDSVNSKQNSSNKPDNDDRCSKNTLDNGEEADAEVEKCRKVRKADVQVVRAEHQKAGRGQVGDHLVHHHQDSAPSRDRIKPVAAKGAKE